MAGFSEIQVIEQLTQVGNKLLQPPKSTLELLNLLDETEVLFSHIRQSPSERVKEALLISQKALIADELFSHSDPNVKVTVAACLNEVMRISAPTPPYEDDKMIEIFELLVSTFDNLSCEPGRCYSKAVLILQSVAKLRSCVMMLDLECDWLVTRMLELFQKNISRKHPHSVLLAMVKIMTVMIEESEPVSLELLKILLHGIRMENQSVAPASWEMGTKILEGCSDKLKPFIMEIVSSMGFCLEDYAPILSSICKSEVDIAANVTDDSPTLANNESADHLDHSTEHMQGSIAPASSSGRKALGIEGCTSKKGRKSNSQNPDKEVAGLERKKVRQGSANQDNKKKNGSPKKDAVFKKVKDEPVDFEHDSSIGKSRPPKRDVPGDKAMRKKNDGPGGSGSSSKKLSRQTRESSGGSGNKSKTGQSKKEKLQLNDSSRNQRKRASSSDDDVFETPHGRKNYKEDLVGSRIKVWWPLDHRYYEGTITSYETSVRKHKVDYDDGDEEVLNLRKEIWEFLGDETPDLASLFDKQTPQPPSVMPQDETSPKEKEKAQTNNEEAGDIEPRDAINDATTEGKSEIPGDIEPRDAINDATTEGKSEIPDTHHEAKRQKLSDEQNP